ncbi:hypothetical protein LLWA12L8_FAMOGCFE_00986 [Lactococcus lactis]|uniref:hypothetical protein n=1 Tax=Lactococcus lactis TaxID=1358 RepID=UPI00384F574D
MSEKKYYVKLNPEVMYYSDYGFGSVQYLEPYLNDVGDFAPAIDRASFTKSEISRLMNESLVRDVGFDDSTEISLVGKIIDDYWINPLIELVPVEDGE